MTLLKQLVIVIAALFLLLFVGTMYLSINNTRDYINDQLRSVAQDTATSLGLTLSAPMSKYEAAIVERELSAIADSGYYREVVITDIHGIPLIERKQAVKLGNVPQWFVDLLPLETPIGEALIMDGWQQRGKVRLTPNPGYAYAALWSTTVKSFWWFLGAFLATTLLGVLALSFILRPLREVEAQAQAICNHEYPVQDRLPWTLELRSVVEAMNRMINKVKQMFEEQALAIDHLREQNYHDPITGLANRAYFDMYLRELSQNNQPVVGGALLLLEIKEFKAYNERHGYKAGDDMLQNMANLLSAVSRGYPAIESFSARLGGASFGVMLKHVDHGEAMEYAQAIASALPRFKERVFTESEEVAHIGVALYNGQSAGELLSAADVALRAAQSHGPNAVHFHGEPGSHAYQGRSATEWKQTLQEALEQNRFRLLLQPVRDAAGSLLHREVLLCLENPDGSLIPAGVFVPMAKRLGILRALDEVTVNAALQQLASSLERGPAEPESLAVNLFPANIQDAAFVDWLCGRLGARPDLARSISFEVAEYGVVENLDALRHFIQRMLAAGAQVGLDHFGRGFASFGYLSTLKIDYIKLDGGFIRGIEANKSNQFFVESVVKIAHGLDIKVVAEFVETQAELDILRALRLDGVQGYAIGRPE